MTSARKKRHAKNASISDPAVLTKKRLSGVNKMQGDFPTTVSRERRSESRTVTIDRSYSVEIDLGRPIPIYQLKLRDISGHGACLLVKEGSSILDHLKVDQVLKMKYWSESRSEPKGFLKGQIKYISKQDEGPFKRHYLIGLFIKDKHEFISDDTQSESLKANADLNDKNTRKGKSDRRLGSERRQLTNTGYVEERRSGQDRRSGVDRRSNVDRRSGVDRRGERNY